MSTTFTARSLSVSRSWQINTLSENEEEEEEEEEGVYDFSTSYMYHGLGTCMVTLMWW